MSLTKEDIANMQVDPIVATSVMMDELQNGLPDAMIVDPNNPMAFFMEAVVFNASVLRDEINTKHLRTYSRLANSESDLYNNMSYEEFKNIFSQPSNNQFRFMINITNFLNNAISTDGYRMASIPEMSTIEVEGYTFLIANRIDIKQFANETYTVEQNVSSSDVGVSTLGVLPYNIITNDDTNRFLVFDTVLKQLLLRTHIFAVKVSDSFVSVIPLIDSLHYVSATITRSGVTYPVRVTYSEVIDPDVASIIVKPLTGKIEVNIPDIYITSGIMVGSLAIAIYTTKGQVDYPMNKLEAGSFKLSLADTTVDKYTSIMNTIDVSNTALNRLTGGSDGKTFEELRTSIITNSIGDTDTPITGAQLLDLVSRDGYYGYLLEDTITTRDYIASRTLASEIGRYTNPDILMYKTTLIPSELVDNVNITTSNDIYDILSIKPNTLFKNVNGVVTPLNNTELTELSVMNTTDKMEYLNSNHILISPYSYITSVKDDEYSMRIVDYKAVPVSFNIKANNGSVLARTNIKTYTITKTDDGYDILIYISHNAEFDLLDMGRVKAQLKLPIPDSASSIYFDSTLDTTDMTFKFTIESDFYVDEDLFLTIENGVSELATKKANLTSQMEFVTYYELASTESGNSSYLNQLVHSNTDITALTLETMTVTFGTALKYLYSNMVVSYTDRQYRRYESDVIAKYTEVVYDTDSIGSLLTPNPALDGVTYAVLHNIGDDIIDPSGNPTVLFKEGDIMLDQNNRPMIDYYNGLVKYVDLLLLEYSHYVTDYDKMMDVLDSLDSYYLDMEEYEKVLLGETRLRFKPFRSNSSVSFRYNKHYKTVAKNIKPMVELLVEEDTILTDNELLNMQNTIGSCIHKHLNNSTIYIIDIKEDIMNSLNFDISAVRVILDREDPNGILSGLEKIILSDQTNRITIAKKLGNVTGMQEYLYDIETKITNI